NTGAKGNRPAFRLPHQRHHRYSAGFAAVHGCAMARHKKRRWARLCRLLLIKRVPTPGWWIYTSGGNITPTSDGRQAIFAVAAHPVGRVVVVLGVRTPRPCYGPFWHFHD